MYTRDPQTQNCRGQTTPAPLVPCPLPPPCSDLLHARGLLLNARGLRRRRRRGERDANVEEREASDARGSNEAPRPVLGCGVNVWGGVRRQGIVLR